ncbi:hypothetical protein B0H14DRAFT_3523552 [Mycena olivaceomarginata]|nr:hypothetical protein B0H14DRAFT_3523552 [Mycena olivaceomarginata]
MSVIVLFLANHDFNFVAASGDSVTSSAESDPVPAGAVTDEARNMRLTNVNGAAHRVMQSSRQPRAPQEPSKALAAGLTQ